MLAARVLADHFARITVIERDYLPNQPDFRRSTINGLSFAGSAPHRACDLAVARGPRQLDCGVNASARPCWSVRARLCRRQRSGRAWAGDEPVEGRGLLVRGGARPFSRTLPRRPIPSPKPCSRSSPPSSTTRCCSPSSRHVSALPPSCSSTRRRST
jgi:hypothetical protein